MQTAVTSPAPTAQQRFERLYITASQIAECLGVTQVAVYKAHECGKLPGSVRITVRGQLVWERTVVEPHIELWRKALEAKRPQYPANFLQTN